MDYTLQLLRSLIDTHPDRAARLLPHVEALELSIRSQPAFCLQNVRTLFEAAHETIAPRLNLAFRRRDGFPDRMRQVIEAMDFSIADHPDAEQINEHLTALLKGIDDTAVALSRLSNVRNLRHGGSLDWGTLERRHAHMLGGLCDSLVAFLFDVAWSRAEPTVEEAAEAVLRAVRFIRNNYDVAPSGQPRMTVIVAAEFLDTGEHQPADVDREKPPHLGCAVGLARHPPQRRAVVVEGAK